MSDITDLIARLETASEGSREFDLDIAKAIYPNWKFRIEPAVPALLMSARVMVTTESGADEHVNISLYTTSLDAALTLVPDGWSWRCGNLPSGRHFASLGTQKSLQEIVGATAPLALCIAALKARAALHESSTATSQPPP